MAKKKAQRKGVKKVAPKTAARTARKGGKKAAGRKGTARDEPSLFRLNIEVGDLGRAATFYGRLFGQEGRLQAGARCYFTCGGVTLQVVDVSSQGKPHHAAKALYFTVRDLDAAFDRARELDCLSTELVHGQPGGRISVRPWGERSFYLEDPWRNPLCFVEAGTVYPG